MPTSLAHHYHQALRDQDILHQLRTHYPDGPTLHQLAPLDQLHIGGIAASTSDTFSFGAAPKLADAPENSFALLVTCA